MKKFKIVYDKTKKRTYSAVDRDLDVWQETNKKVILLLLLFYFMEVNYENRKKNTNFE